MCFSSFIQLPGISPGGETPASRPFFLATMTALRNKDGGVRGIATGSSLRRLVAKTLARQFGRIVEQECAPFQFALSTRAGTDCVGHAIRAMTDLNSRATVLSVDGIGAYDHVLRSSMLGKLLEVPLRALIPFVRTAYAQPTSYEWEDQHGSRHQIWQHEGGEQGDPSLPLLFCLAVHNSLTAIQDQLRPGEYVFAFLDDIYVVSLPERTRAIFNLVAEKLGEGAGVELHAGKTRVWNRAGDCPPVLEELGPEVWNAVGIKILGTPVGTCAARLAEGDKLVLICNALGVLVQCAGPRCHHFLRTMPPSRSAEYAEGHDVGMQQAMESLLEGLPGDARHQEVATQIASLPSEWEASGSDQRHVWHRRLFGHLGQTRCPCCKTDSPRFQTKSQTFLMGHKESFKQPHRCSIDRNGFVSRPGWRALQGEHVLPINTGPSLESDRMVGSTSRLPLLNTIFGRRFVFAQSCAAEQAHLRSHSGAESSDVLCGCPMGPEFKILPTLFRTVVCERLRLPLQLTDSRCECGAALDKCGRHRGACPRSGRSKCRATAPERTLARVCHEAGGMVGTT